jgi:penicillin V acylase-like amidase (Ntn superfamily)
LLLVVGLVWSAPPDAHPCTALFTKQSGNSLVGINYDWHFGDGLVIVNKRGVSKTAMGLNPGPLARWTSKYGSVTFSQYGRELVQSGINEAGLFVAGLLLPETQWPDPDSRPSVRSAQWVQYQLDNSASVEEVIRSDKNVRISSTGSSTVHFFVCDKTGSCAVIEFIEGKPIHRFGAELPVKVLTDSLYSRCIESLGTGKAPEEDRAFAVKRFVETDSMIRRMNDTAESIDQIFNILKKAEHSTQWSIVYDLSKLQVHFRSASNEKTRHFSLSEFDFSCDRPVKVLDVQAPFSGAVGAKFSDYTLSGNRDLIEKAFKKTKSLSNLPSYIVDEHSLYPESLVCTRGGARPQ